MVYGCYFGSNFTTQTNPNFVMSKPKLKNVLPNTYVPLLSKKVLAAAINRLPKSSIVALLLLWPKLKNTQPQLPKENAMGSQIEYCRQIREEAKSMRLQKWTKSRIVDKILYEFWSDGLNLLQLAQIDCQLIVDNPNAYFWVLSTAKNAWGDEVPLSLDPASFLALLARHLSDMFMCYIYVCTHPDMPLILIRIQVFDLLPSRGGGRSRVDRPHITSHKPYFLAIPMNSPHIIHSPGNDLVSEIVLQVVESSLPQDPRNVVRVEKTKSQKAVRSLESMHILKGCSRFANCMGAWTPYADGVADVSPLASLDDHLVVNERKSIKESDSDDQKLRKLANIRFKGTSSGTLVSERMFDHNKPIGTRKRPLEEDEEGRRGRPRKENEFASIASIRYAEFEIQEPLEADSDHLSHVVVKLVGTDVFGGMHELAVQNPDLDKAVVDPSTVPGWLTGEEGLSCGIVKNGVFSAT